MKTALNKVMRIGSATVFTVGLAVTLALLLGMTTAALAAAPGDPFKLGRLNAVNAVSSLVGKSTGAMLRIDNNSSAKNSRALSLEVQPGKTPLAVNAAAGKATNLDADKVDGQNASALFSGKTYDVTNSRTGGGNGSFVGIAARCDDGDKALGGGGNTATDDDEMTDSAPAAIPEAWSASFRDNGVPGNFTASARCADFPPLR